MGELATKLREPKPAKPAKPTLIDEIMAELDDDDREAFAAALVEKDGRHFRVSSARLAELMKSAGHEIGASTIKTHRQSLA